MNQDRILAIDVGAGTQDILLWEAGQPMENNVKLVLPSWTTILARRVKQATREGRPVFLTGNLMAAGLGYHFAAPYGDMMLTGCFGLVSATRRLLNDK